MRILNFGSVNIDHVYRVPHFVQPGETLASSEYHRYAGGKGYNQSVALARAGAEVHHAGLIGEDGLWLREALAADGVNTEHLKTIDYPTGHAIIQVDAAGQNSIVLAGGANQRVAADMIESVLENYGTGDLLLLQNEISSIPTIMRQAAKRGLGIAFNPAPMTEAVHDYPLDLVNLFIVNEIEAAALSRLPQDAAPEDMLSSLRQRFPKAHILLTLGAAGAMVLADDSEPVKIGVLDVPVVDTTAAGDTFIGYFLATRTSGKPLSAALAHATVAASICVTRMGASPSIPDRDEVEAGVKNWQTSVQMKLEELGIAESDIEAAVSWARKPEAE